MARYIKKTEGVYVSQTWVSRLWRDNDLQAPVGGPWTVTGRASPVYESLAAVGRLAGTSARSEPAEA